MDLAAWTLLAWIMGSRGSETVKKLGFLLVIVLAALAAVEAALAG